MNFLITLAQRRREGISSTGQLSRNDGHVRARNTWHVFIQKANHIMRVHYNSL